VPVLSNERLVVATQTTLSLDDTAAIVTKLKETFSDIEFPRSDDICYATQNRQDAVKELVQVADHILIIGSTNSSNTMRLLELAQKSGVSAELVPNPLEYEPSKELTGKTIGISSGASAPEVLVETLIAKLSSLDTKIETLNIKEEKITFPLPAGLR
jgi:4-hydroxy-3-methylbut-2-enyl diphosphate reductase